MLATESNEANPTPQANSGWSGRLELGFERRDDRTLLTHRRHVGPLVVQRPFHPEPNGTCHTYLVHPPGGVVGGDALHLSIDVGANADALVTTPAANKLYRSAGPTAEVGQDLRVADGATLEWLPQETIVFSGARAELSTRVVLEPTARFIGWEIVCLGRRASGESFDRGRFAQRIEIWRGDRPLWLERVAFDAGDPVQSAAWGLGGKTVAGTMVATIESPEAISRISDGVETRHGLFGATQVRDAIACRYLGDSGEEAREAFARAWEILRVHVCGREAEAPRVWAT